MRLSWTLLPGEELLTDGETSGGFTFAYPPTIGSCWPHERKPEACGLARSHLRSLAPLPKEELLALKRSITELGAIGRNINQIAHAANTGRPLPDSVSAEFRAMLRICEGLRVRTKSLLKANLASWRSDHDEPP